MTSVRRARLFHTTPTPSPRGVLLRVAIAVPLLVSGALAAPGDLDPSFGRFGELGRTVKHGVSMALNDRRGLAVQSDGKLVVAGYDGTGLMVMRLQQNGDLDPTFGSGGIATPAHPTFVVRGTSVAIQSDGKIVVGGWADTLQTDLMVARLTASGSPDSTFDGDGFVTTDFDGGTDQAFAVEVQPDGRIVAVGRASIGGDDDFAVVRYDPDGSLDATFSGDGRASVEFGADDAAYAMALQPDGKIVVAGTRDDHIDADFAVARLDPAGNLDATFLGGKLTTGFGGVADGAEAVAVLPSGKILVAGDDGDNVRVARYQPNGVLDITFDGDGKLSFGGLDGGIFDAAVQPDGRIVLLGYAQDPGDGPSSFVIYRRNANGSPDPTFGSGGEAHTTFGGVQDRGHDMQLYPDGRVIAFGESDGKPAFVRYRVDGTVDEGGLTTLACEAPGFPVGSNETAMGMAIQADGKYVVAGYVYNTSYSASDAVLARFDADGYPDPTFGNGGSVVFGSGTYDFANAVAIDPEGRIVVGGTCQSGGVTDFMVARFNSDGSADSTFALFGIGLLDFAGGPDYGNAVAIAPDGKIVVAGTVFSGVQNVLGVARFNSDGTVDETFDADGKAIAQFGSFVPHWGTAVVVTPSLKVVVGGEVDGNFAYARFTPSGSPDNTFGAFGKRFLNLGANDHLSALALAPDGWIYSAGTFFVSGTQSVGFALVQMDSTGNTPGSCPSPPCSTWLGGKVVVGWTFLGGGTSLDLRDDGVVVAGSVGSEVAYAQVAYGYPNAVIQKRFDLPGTSTANAVKFIDHDWIVAAGEQEYSGDRNIALARWEATSGAVAVSDPGPPVTMRLHGVYPNPLFDRSRFAFDLPAAGAARLVVYDVSGRAVRTLADGVLPAGRHARTWDGIDDRGRRVAAGVYYARLEAGVGQATTPVVVVGR